MWQINFQKGPIGEIYSNMIDLHGTFSHIFWNMIYSTRSVGYLQMQIRSYHGEASKPDIIRLKTPRAGRARDIESLLTF